MAIVFEDYSPVFVGDTLKPFAPVVQTRDPLTGNLVPFDLTGLTISMRMLGEDGTIKVCSGPWTIDDALAGKCHYQYQSADVNKDQIWTMQMAFTDSLGHAVHSDVKLLQILPVI